MDMWYIHTMGNEDTMKLKKGDVVTPLPDRGLGTVRHLSEDPQPIEVYGSGMMRVHFRLCGESGYFPCTMFRMPEEASV